MLLIRAVVAVALSLTLESSGVAAELDPSEELPAFSDSPLELIGKALGCAVVGVPTCVYFGFRNNDEFSSFRSAGFRDVQIGYFPSYVLDLAESKAFQRFEVNGVFGNTLIAVSHRRGVSEPNEFSSTSYRLAYSFDWRHVQPAFGIGLRRNVNARNGDAIEIWLPVYSNRKKIAERGDDFLVFFETLWVIGRDGIRPEIQGRFHFPLTENFELAAGVGYFADYHNPEAEISVGPVGYF